MAVVESLIQRYQSQIRDNQLQIVNDVDVTNFEFLSKTQIQKVTLIQCLNFKFAHPLQSLRQLQINHSQLSDLNNIYELTNLLKLDLSNNHIEILTQLPDQLTELKLNQNKIRDIFVLRNLKLKVLEISRNQVSDISVINQTELQVLIANNNQIINVDELQNSISLDLSQNQIRNIKFVHKMINAKTINLGFNQITDISYIQQFAQLEQLTLNNNQITEFKQTLPNLKILDLRNNQVQNLEHIQKCPKLTQLYVENNAVESLKGIEQLKLEILYAANNKISDIQQIRNMTSIETLDLANNLITDIYPLKKLVNVQLLYLNHNRILNAEVINHLAIVKTLFINNNKIDPSVFKNSINGSSAFQTEQSKEEKAVNLRINIIHLSQELQQDILKRKQKVIVQKYQLQQKALKVLEQDSQMHQKIAFAYSNKVNQEIADQ
ncbi:leucine-rich_repeat domain-containing protein [Hexamita inflata]|uniref:Leucine-rich repeat domain-containing protein n=1 Tax=Hexamita inflata TaxID=28002 RepID=A0AA86USG5_9EUKA|nr:leucine-rich repeat domain-containing protein [Hexamita inflata]